MDLRVDAPMYSYDYLIVGGGMTADAAAHGIRDIDSSGSIGIISAEPEPPYSRPPLSKALWKGEDEASVWRPTAETNAALHLGRMVTRLDAAAKSVTDDEGNKYAYRSLLLATGGTPRRFPFQADVLYYRTLGDYRRLRTLTQEQQRFAVIGGGFIGSEIAAALAMNGKSVTMLFPEHGIGARVFPNELARFLVGYYIDKGVDVRSGTSVDSIGGSAGDWEVRTTAGQTLRAGSLVAGLGITPNVELARSAGAAVSDGIDVDPRLRTSVDDVFAAGDVANAFVPALGLRQRVEHEDNALTMGRAAGRSMAGDSTPYEHLPFFYSDLFDLGYEAVGILDSRLEVVADWKEPFREGVVYYLGDGRVRGVLLWNVWGHVDSARALIAARGPFSPEQLRGRIPG